MGFVIWLVGGILAIIILLGLVMVMYYRKNPTKRKETDYYTFFVLGISWVPIGIVFWLTLDMPFGMVFFMMGICYLAIGLANRDKWKTDKRRWKR